MDRKEKYSAQLERMKSGKGFIAALDQSGGSTPKALAQYGVEESSFANDEEMYLLVHEMRTRIIKSPKFNSSFIIGAILFENTMDRKIDGEWTADYLWNKKGIVPFLKVDKGLSELKDGVQIMKPITNLDALLSRAVERNIFGTKMRSLIKEANSEGIRNVVKQQFVIAHQIFEQVLVPIIEPEIDIKSTDKAKSEEILKAELKLHLDALDESVKVILKLTLPETDNFYADLQSHPNVVRVVALSGGYSKDEANRKLAANNGLIASFSRALVEGVTFNQSDDDFNLMIDKSINEIYKASIT
ncbi:fructose-bisphosphate aldolase class I [Flavobacterium sp. 7E]|uniref:fructose bisphosphate aldolase n=1 Tax=unclassified Flavobacterium TaxID=196869 RepID=UPI00156E61CF|nr:MULTISPECIES: fructose bisphosphate aldolase [unclassified Flavobacterium]MBE0392115.1 Fructose-bisphosphate aldolase class 1 [Flavobacterium sp. PL002]NRS87976.1 fructose-bisphosphate aldolase class I [Flavobacterium sp. 7E]